MSCVRWLHVRVWTGPLPVSHLLTEEEYDLERRLSALYFGSHVFADLRTQIRLQLQEMPPITQTRRGAPVYAALLDSFQVYLPMLMAVKRFADATQTERSKATPVETLLFTFPPMLYGLGAINLRALEGLAGRSQRTSYCLAVELVLVCFVMAQLQSILAEAQTQQALRVQSEGSLRKAEQAWQDTQSKFAKVVSNATRDLDSMPSDDPLLSSMRSLIDAVRLQATMLSQICAIHRITLRVAILALDDDQPTERLTRLVSLQARRAYTIAHQTSSRLSDLPENVLCRQLAWVLQVQELRWKAMYYDQEQTIFHLDAQPVVALCYCDALLRLRMPALPPFSHRADSYFTRLAQELQVVHQTQLTEAMDQKRLLLELCHNQYGAELPNSAAYIEERDKVVALMLPIRLVPGSVLEDEVMDNQDTTGDESSELLASITANVRSAIEHDQRDGYSTCSSQSNALATIHPPAMKSQEILNALDRNDPMNNNSSSHARHQSLAIGPTTARPSSASATVTGSWRSADKSSAAAATNATVSSAQPDSTKKVFLDNSLQASASTRLLQRPASSPCYLSSSSSSSSSIVQQSKTCPNPAPLAPSHGWVPMRAACALCERRTMRANLPGVVVMKRIFNLRRKWSMVLQDTKKFSAASALYARAHVCAMCNDILQHEETVAAANPAMDTESESKPPLDDPVGQLILQSILYQWHTQPPPSTSDLLVDAALNQRARQSSTRIGHDARFAVQSDSIRCAQTQTELQPWWEVDLGNYVVVHTVKIWLRDDRYVDHTNAAGGNSRGSMASLSIAAASARGSQQQQVDSKSLSNAYPLHVAISMKTGVGRDLDDVITSSVTSSCITEQVVQPITWTAPPNARGRFVRIQSEKRTTLQIERVQVLMAQPNLSLLLPDQLSTQRRQLMKRAAFRASMMVKRMPTTEKPKDSGSPKSHHAMYPKQMQGHEPPVLASTFLNPEQAETRRLSRLYARFRGLLDARSKYVPEPRNPPTQVQEEPAHGQV